MTSLPTPHRLRLARRLLAAGGVVAYPTEAVWGLGGDPFNRDALERIVALKGRDAAKGFIVVASRMAQLAPLVEPLSDEQVVQLRSSWPGPVTWLLPARESVHGLLTGGRPTLAARIPDHPVVQALCEAFGGALVSTSANLSGHRPARTTLDVHRIFGAGVDLIVPGPTGGRERPSEIRALDGRILRRG